MRRLLAYLLIGFALIHHLSAKHVLFLTGEVTHGWGQHERPASSMLLAGLLMNVDPGITTEVVLVDADGWPTQAQIDRADCIFINTYGYKGHIINSDARMSALENHMNQGKGLCAISFGLAVSSANLRERWKDIVGANWRSNGVALFFTEALSAPAGEDHAILNGVSDYSLNDEIFFNFERAAGSAGALTPLMVHNAQGIDFPSDAGIRGNANAQARKDAGFEFMLAWAFEPTNGGRSFCHGGGRYHFNLAKDAYRKNLINGIMWTMGEEVPTGGYDSLTPSAMTMLANIEGVDKTSWNSTTGLANLQRALNFNQVNAQAANWRNDATKSGIRLTRLPNNIPASYSSEVPSPEFNLDEPRHPSNDPRASVFFKRLKLSSDYITEGAAIADMDGDGINDLVAGPAWWKGPALTTAYSYKPVIHTEYLDPNGNPIPFGKAPGGALSIYTKDFFVFPADLDEDQWMDLITVARQGEAGTWYQNPAQNPFEITNTTSSKTSAVYQNEVNCESPLFVDVIGDSVKELISFNRNRVTITSPANSTKLWTQRTISEESAALYRRNHGLGAGDINGDGRVDILVNHGWYEQPGDLENQAVWTFHPQRFATAAAQIQVFDVDGDGDNDVVTALAAHGYGMAWYEASGAPGAVSFTQHMILSETGKVDDSPAGVNFSQLHCMEAADIDGDGVKDIVTGKCHLAHNASARDPDPLGDPVIYWFKIRRNSDGTVDFVPSLIDDDSGVGRQISVGDIDGDGKLDIATGNKKGVYAFLQSDAPEGGHIGSKVVSGN